MANPVNLIPFTTFKCPGCQSDVSILVDVAHDATSRLPNGQVAFHRFGYVIDTAEILIVCPWSDRAVWTKVS